MFKEIGITYSVYNRGLYYDLIYQKNGELGTIYNIDDCKRPEKLKEFNQPSSNPEIVKTKSLI